MRKMFDTDIYCITGEAFSRGRSNIEVIAEMIDAGINVIQYREKDKNMGEKFEECLKIRKMTRDAGVFFIVNDHVDLAMAVDADGVHVGQNDMPVEVIRTLTHGNMVIGLSTHSVFQAQKALEEGVDYIGVGPIFETRTKKDVCDPVGYDYLDYVIQSMNIPFVAIGGIKTQHVEDLARRGVRCMAMITEIVGADNIGERIRAIRNIMKKGLTA